MTSGGAQENIINLSEYLSQKKYDIDIISLRKRNDYHAFLKKRKYKIVSFIQADSFHFFILPFIALFIAIQIAIRIKIKKYALLIGSHEYYPFYLTIIFAKLFGIKSLLLVGNNTFEEFSYKSWFFSFIHKPLIQFTYTYADKLICVSESLGNALKRSMKIPEDKITIIYNGIDIQEIKKLSKEPIVLPESKDLKTICVLGKLIEKKGHFHMLKAFVIVKKTYPNIKLLIVGEGKFLPKLKEFSQKLHLENDVKFLGYVKDNPYKYLSASTLFVFPSLYEGFGNVILQAMACGLPIISTNAPYGPSEILNGSLYSTSKKVCYGKYGILVPAFTRNNNSTFLSPEEELLAETIIDLLTNEKKRKHYKKMSLQRVKYFSSKKMAKLHANVIEQLINK